MPRFMGLFVISSVFLFAWAETDTVLILHTNDMHGHVLPLQNGGGGMAYVKAFLDEQRAARPDTVSVDAGDWSEKGDMVAELDHCAFAFEAVGKLGYDAMAPGNHDLVVGMETMLERAQEHNLPLVGLNVFAPDGTRPFPASRIVDADGVKVGLIGLSAEYGQHGPRWYQHVSDLETAKTLLAEEVARVDEEADVVVAVSHLGPDECEALSEAVPAVDVFVGGHTHTLLVEPVRVAGTGALIVQAGGDGRFAGRLELTIDMDSEEVVAYQGRSVDMVAEYGRMDGNFYLWAKQREFERCPQAARALTWSSREITKEETARLCVEAFLEKTGAGAALCCAKQLHRPLPTGLITHNFVFSTVTRPYLSEVVIVEMTGGALNGFIAADAKNRIQWRSAKPLEPQTVYRVAMRKKDLDEVLLPSLGEAASGVSYTVCDFTVCDAVVDYLDAHHAPALDEILVGVEERYKQGDAALAPAA